MNELQFVIYPLTAMTISIFDIFSIGIGPSSSHTLGPLRAATSFVKQLRDKDCLKDLASLKIELYGSLALTGEGHGTTKAIVLGLWGFDPEIMDFNQVPLILDKVQADKKVDLCKLGTISFDIDQDIHFLKEKYLPYHSNAMRFKALNKTGEILLEQVAYSLGGGFIIRHEETKKGVRNKDGQVFPFPIKTGGELLEICTKENMSIAEVVLANELTLRTKEEIDHQLVLIEQVMEDCINRGLNTQGILPGGLKVKRRAPDLYAAINEKKDTNDLALAMDYVTAWALAVNEENASGGRVVTTPTNGAAGVLPAVLWYYKYLTSEPKKEKISDFFMTAGAIGILFKQGASISAAEMGCQGEIGVACSMAAAALAAAQGGSPIQVEKAAEIGMEHNLGLTCDPVMGLVQIPCIERNAMGAVQAINAARIALAEKEPNKVSLDQVIRTMRQTGRDMKSIYKETSLGGLAVNVPEC